MAVQYWDCNCLHFPLGRGYQYTGDLLALDSCRAPRFGLPSLRFAAVITPLQWERWQHCLRSHPAREYAAYIVRGIRSGFRVGFQYGLAPCQSAQRNMLSASQCQGKISEFLATECAAGRVLGPFSRDLVPMVQVNRMGAVPKSTPGKYRLIVDLSYPEGQSVNSRISESQRPSARCRMCP